VPDVILPVLDEAAALPGVLAAMPAGFRPIVVDNGSSDGSAEIAAECGAEVVREPQRGFGSACYAGLRAASAEIVCFMDCDGSVDAGQLPEFVDRLGGGADLVVGARRPEPGAWPFHARVANRMLALELRRRTGLKLSDNGPMRAASRLGLLELELRDRRSGWPLEMVLLANAAGWRIAELPISYRRRSGRSKVTGTVRGTAQAVSDMSGLLRGIEGERGSGRLRA
jgi:glycosyltransferase involved in cell wall biosynthesis